MDATPQRLNTDDVSSNNPVPNDGPPAYDALEEDINPPVYTHIERPPLPIRRLNLSRSAGSPEYSTITPGQCVAHLKFVAVISDLRDSIISNDGLFGINDNDADDFLEQKNEALVLLREKRWAIYTARAVERYTAWWNNYVPYSSPPPKLKDIESKEYGKITECETQVQWFQETMPPLADRMTFRRMMSRYWDNESPFALDLVGAVIRQGSFIQKMDNIDWLHSPALPETMSRLVKKYSIFFAIMTSAPRRMAVPTLDVDLAWHTHQLTPYRYFQYSINAWRAGYPPIFIDHDDKVDEVKLSDGFEWTSKMYKKFTDGEIYSECTCWYCEAVRAPDLRDGFFVSSSTSRARKLAAELHSRPDISPNPDKNAHISAHSAVRAQLPYHPADIRRMKALYLKCNYEKACRRAQKRGSLSGKTPDPPTDKGRSESNGNNDPTSATGSRRFEPAFGPQICVGAYAANPTCMSLAPGSYGNCAAVDQQPAEAEE
ncbi:hypothetical protein MW887_006605 [Aspergillus wentii]|nr:hypothetical protein MW887_006605 [Aspergillus wentii]